MDLCDERRRAMETFAQSLGLEMKEVDLLNKAFIHTSYANEKGLPEHQNNERLEFLGDSVLGYLISEYLFNNSERMREGDLSKLKARVVCQKVLAHRARDIGLGNYLLLGRGEELSGGRYRDSILADCFEAVVGAILLVCGIEPVRQFLYGQLTDEIENIYRGEAHVVDYKSILQELAQKELNQLPRYKVLKSEGPDHDPTFEITVSIQDRVLGAGQGKSKKNAEQLAARRALENSPSVFKEIRAAVRAEKKE